MLKIDGSIKISRAREALWQLLYVANAVECEGAHLAVVGREPHNVGIALRKAQTVRREHTRIGCLRKRMILHLDHPSALDGFMQVGQKQTTRYAEILIALQQVIKEIRLVFFGVLQRVSPVAKHGFHSVNTHHLITLVVKRRRRHWSTTVVLIRPSVENLLSRKSLRTLTQQANQPKFFVDSHDEQGWSKGDGKG